MALVHSVGLVGSWSMLGSVKKMFKVCRRDDDVAKWVRMMMNAAGDADASRTGRRFMRYERVGQPVYAFR
jgi:hypothetical protein